MVRNLAKLGKLDSSFLSCEKDMETILKKLFIENQPYSEELKRLLVINAKDCLSNKTSQKYKDKLDSLSLSKMVDDGYVRVQTKIRLPEHADVKSYIIISFDDFTPNVTNPQFRDCIVTFDVICHTDCWDVEDYRIRPLKICGYIDGILNNTKLSGIGTFQFAGCSRLILSEDLSGYVLIYNAIHGSDDIIPAKE